MMYVIWAALTFASIQVRNISCKHKGLKMLTPIFCLADSYSEILHIYMPHHLSAKAYNPNYI